MPEAPVNEHGRFYLWKCKIGSADIPSKGSDLT